MGRLVILLLFGVSTLQLGTIGWENRNRTSYLWKVWCRFTPKLLAEVVLVYAVAGTVIFILWDKVPGMGWGWYNLLSSDHQAGNILVSPAIGILAKPLFIGFLLLLLLLFPILAEIEEISFRKGKNTPNQWIPASIRFGFIHLIMGVPIAFGFGLTIVGFAFARKYLTAQKRFRERYPNSSLEEAENEGVAASTAMHTLSNTVIFLVVLLVILLFT